MTNGPAQLLSFLSRKSSYSHSPREVTHIQTHISHVFLAPPYVYKIKKPVNFDFLDFSDLEKRRHYCRREIRLNRRLCGEIYLGVVPIVRSGEDYRLAEKAMDPVESKRTKGDREVSGAARESGAAGEVVEYAVKMKQLSEEHFLHAYIERDELDREKLDRVAEKLTDFYRSQEPGEEILQWGAVDKIRYNTDENFRQTESYVGSTVDRTAFRSVRWYTDRCLNRQRELFEKRIREKRIVDGHGDLHLEHIHLSPGGVCIYDCIEFNERFRYGDLAADLAFLAMDLDFNGHRMEGRYMVNTMARNLEDSDLPRIINFYKCYRAYVKGKVKSFQSAEEEVPREERKKAARTARRYFRLSLSYAVLGSSPLALIVMGTIGSGKSTLSGELSDRLSLERYSSDRIRKELAGLPLEERTPPEKKPMLYSRESSDRTYGKLRNNALEKLKKGENVVLDATYGSRERRNALAEALDSAGVDYCFVECRAPEDTLKKRLKKREEAGNVISDARLEDYKTLAGKYASPREIAPHHRIAVNTDRPVRETVEKCFRKLSARRLEKRT